VTTTTAIRLCIVVVVVVVALFPGAAAADTLLLLASPSMAFVFVDVGASSLVVVVVGSELVSVSVSVSVSSMRIIGVPSAFKQPHGTCDNDWTQAQLPFVASVWLLYLIFVIQNKEIILVSGHLYPHHEKDVAILVSSPQGVQ